METRVLGVSDRTTARVANATLPSKQYSVGSFVIDFFSVEIKLGIELDGDSHFQPGAAEYDREREQFIESFGIRIVRILNTEVYDNLDGVLEMIGREVLKRREQANTL